MGGMGGLGGGLFDPTMGLGGGLGGGWGGSPWGSYGGAVSRA